MAPVESEEVEAVKLSEEIMQFSQVGKTIDGKGFACWQLDCVSRSVKDISILEQFICLRQIDLSKNQIADVAPLADLPHVLRLSLASNEVGSIDCWKQGSLPHLMFLDLSGNKLQAIPALHMPALKQISFSRNAIASCEEFKGHTRLEKLDLSGNQLAGPPGLTVDFQMLQELQAQQQKLVAEKTSEEAEEDEDAQGNAAEEENEEDAAKEEIPIPLMSVAGFCGLPALEILNLSDNSCRTLEGPWEEMPSLSHLDLSGNKVSTVKPGLEALRRLAALKKLGLKGNPVTEQDDINIRHEILICMLHRQHLLAVDEESITREERSEAKELDEKRQEEERERIRQEEEAAEALRLEEEEAARAAAEAAEEEDN